MTPETTVEQIKKEIYQRYLDCLGLTEEELVGKTILDVGSGFADFASMAGSKAGVVSLDPFYKNECTCQILRERHQNYFPSKLVAGVAENLPFQAESFDLVLSLSVIPLQEWNLQESYEALAELIQVTKPGGKIILAYRQFLEVHPYTIAISEETVLPRFEIALSFEELKKVFAERLKNETETILPLPMVRLTITGRQSTFKVPQTDFLFILENRNSNITTQFTCIFKAFFDFRFVTQIREEIEKVKPCMAL